MPPAFKSVPAIEKCFAILDLLVKEENPLGISEISKHLGLNKSTVFNLVYTLMDLKVLEGHSDGKFGFGPCLYILGNASGRHSELIGIIHPYLTRINKETRLSTFLGLRSDLKTVLIDKVESTYTIKISSEIGMQMPTLGGVGIKAMLSFLSRDQVDGLIKDEDLKEYTANSIVDKNTYLEEIDMVRANGIAYDREEYIEGIAAIGIPVRTQNSRIQAAVWVMGLKRQISKKPEKILERLLKDIALEINQRLGQ